MASRLCYSVRLEELKPRGFAVRSCHATLYPVEMPPWLPVEVLVTVARFWRHLRAELIILIQGEASRQRNASSLRDSR